MTVPSKSSSTGITITFLFYVFFFSPLARWWYLFLLYLPTVLYCGQSKRQVHYSACSLFLFFFFCWLSYGLVVDPRLNDPFLSQNPRVFFSFHFQGWILGYSHYHYYYYYITPSKFSLQRLLMVFHCNLSDSKSPQVFLNFLNILVDINNAVVFMVSACHLISKSSYSFSKLWGLYRAHHLKLVSPSPSNSITIFSSLAWS